MLAGEIITAPICLGFVWLLWYAGGACEREQCTVCTGSGAGRQVTLRSQAAPGAQLSVVPPPPLVTLALKISTLPHFHFWVCKYPVLTFLVSFVPFTTLFCQNVSSHHCSFNFRSIFVFEQSYSAVFPFFVFFAMFPCFSTCMLNHLPKWLKRSVTTMPTPQHKFMFV